MLSGPSMLYTLLAGVNYGTMETLKSVGILYLQDFLRGGFDKVPTKVWIKKKKEAT